MHHTVIKVPSLAWKRKKREGRMEKEKDVYEGPAA